MDILSSVSNLRMPTKLWNVFTSQGGCRVPWHLCAGPVEDNLSDFCRNILQLDFKCYEPNWWQDGQNQNHQDAVGCTTSQKLLQHWISNPSAWCNPSVPPKKKTEKMLWALNQQQRTGTMFASSRTLVDTSCRDTWGLQKDVAFVRIVLQCSKKTVSSPFVRCNAIREGFRFSERFPESEPTFYPPCEMSEHLAPLFEENRPQDALLCIHVFTSSRQRRPTKQRSHLFQMAQIIHGARLLPKHYTAVGYSKRREEQVLAILACFLPSCS